MRKIPTLFMRDEATNRKYVRDEVTPGCEWVLAGEGTATRKYDGTCVYLDTEGFWWARREVKPGKEPPADFLLADYDETTGKSVGWEPIQQSSYLKWFEEALRLPSHDYQLGGTYELCGPKINGNPEGWHQHYLIRHEDAQVIPLAEALTFDSLRVRLTTDWPFEGIVWHHADGRMCKLKKRDFPQEAR